MLMLTIGLLIFLYKKNSTKILLTLTVFSGKKPCIKFP